MTYHDDPYTYEEDPWTAASAWEESLDNLAFDTLYPEDPDAMEARDDQALDLAAAITGRAPRPFLPA